jgi:Tol biopolymer transport system component
MRSLVLLAACGVLASLAGCGGGGSSQSTKQPPPPTNANVLAYLHRVADLTYQITVLKSDGTTALVGSSNSYISVVLAPGGQRVLFSYFGGSSTGYQIATMNVDGSGLRNLGPGLYPQYTPDGSKIVYQYSGLSVMNADGSQQTVIASTSGAEYCFPATNGSIIAAGMYAGASQGLATMSLNGSNPQVIVPSIYLVFPSFSADGGTIIFSNSGGNGQNIYSVSASGGNLTPLTSSLNSWDPLVVGNKIYFDYIPPTVQNPTTDSNQIYSMNLDGTNLTAVTKDALYDGFKTFNGNCGNP